MLLERRGRMSGVKGVQMGAPLQNCENNKRRLYMKRIWIMVLMTGFFGLFCSRASAGSYTDGTYIVTDNITNLVWQKQDDATGRTWEAAISYCESLSLGSFTDWRLPNVKELGSLVDDSRVGPSIDPLFTGTISSGYWSSTTYAGSTTSAWDVYFNSGSTLYYSKTGSYYVRCVRGQ